MPPSEKLHPDRHALETRGTVQTKFIAEEGVIALTVPMIRSLSPNYMPGLGKLHNQK
jgi:hypothetical protein